MNPTLGSPELDSIIAAPVLLPSLELPAPVLLDSAPVLLESAPVLLESAPVLLDSAPVLLESVVPEVVAASVVPAPPELLLSAGVPLDSAVVLGEPVLSLPPVFAAPSSLHAASTTPAMIHTPPTRRFHVVPMITLASCVVATPVDLTVQSTRL